MVGGLHSFWDLVRQTFLMEGHGKRKLLTYGSQ
jgi:hypothetical protein